MRFFLLLAILLAAPSVAQTVDGRPVAGRWLALSVRGDSATSADLAQSRLEKVLVVHLGGRVLLRGTDRVQGGGRDAAFTGRLTGRRVRFDGLPGAATLHVEGRRLIFTDPHGVATVFLSWPPDGRRTSSRARSVRPQ